jgi:hypothetical protein
MTQEIVVLMVIVAVLTLGLAAYQLRGRGLRR